MLPPSTPIDETERLLSLHALRILDTPSEERFDRITRMAKRFFGVDICLISLADGHRQWFKSNRGFDASETAREISFCAHAINSDEIFVITDAARDERFCDSPLVVNTPFVRFYAGLPIHNPSGYRVGTLCIFDSQERRLIPAEQDSLKEFAAMVEDQLKVAAQATIDELTQVANRRGFNMVANHMLSLCRRTGVDAELLFFDLDGFKELNDVHGHQVGDDLLRYFAELLIRCFRKADVIARLGGDEFVVMLAASNENSKAAIDRLADMVLKEKCGLRRNLSWSVGRVRFDQHRHESIGGMLEDADLRMYEHKLQRRQSTG